MKRSTRPRLYVSLLSSFLHVFDEITVMIQAELKKDLAEETERNKDIMHLGCSGI